MAVRGNKFWLNRAKHGREAIFSDPALLWGAACEYFDWADKNKLISVEFNGKDAVECKVPKMRAFTMRGLSLYLGVHRAYIFELKESLLKPRSKSRIKNRAELLEVIERIENVIYVQKFEGAAAGFLNANLVSRELGLAEKQQIEANVDSNVNATITGPVEVVVRTSGIPFAAKDGEVDTDRPV